MWGDEPERGNRFWRGTRGKDEQKKKLSYQN